MSEPHKSGPHWLAEFCTSVALACLMLFAPILAVAVDAPVPEFAGRLVDLGGHRLHVNCSGKGRPTVVVENGLGDFSFDWILVQNRVSQFTRICTYDRAGYAWSDPGPKPRTFAQINLELRDALSKLGERGPFIMVGHSYGGPVARNFAVTYSHEIAGLVLVDAAFEGQRVGIGDHKTILLGDGAKGVDIPTPREDIRESDRPPLPAGNTSKAISPYHEKLDPMYNVLPPLEQSLQLWAQSLPNIYDAEESQRKWSTEYFARQLAKPQAGTLGALPLIVLTRAKGGYGDDLDVPAAQMEAERKQGQANLARLSTNSQQIIVSSGHNMELGAPDKVCAAIRKIVDAIRLHGGSLSSASDIGHTTISVPPGSPR